MSGHGKAHVWQVYIRVWGAFEVQPDLLYDQVNLLQGQRSQSVQEKLSTPRLSVDI